MFLAAISLPFGANWYDVIVVLALAYGLASGMRTGLSGELIRVAGVVLMVILAWMFYANIGTWLESSCNVPGELANLLGFVIIAVAVYLVTLGIRLAVRHWLKKLKFTAAVDNFGGALAGVLRMAAFMALLSVGLWLTRSAFWKKHVEENSRFGSFVVAHFPAVAAAVETNFPDEVWLLQDLKRRAESTLEDPAPKKP